MSWIRATHTTVWPPGWESLALRFGLLDKSHSHYGLASSIRVTRTTSYTGLLDTSHTTAWPPEQDFLAMQLTLASWIRITRITAYWIRVSRTTVLDTSHSHYSLHWPPELAQQLTLAPLTQVILIRSSLVSWIRVTCITAYANPRNKILCSGILNGPDIWCCSHVSLLFFSAKQFILCVVSFKWLNVLCLKLPNVLKLGEKSACLFTQ